MLYEVPVYFFINNFPPLPKVLLLSRGGEGVGVNFFRR